MPPISPLSDLGATPLLSGADPSEVLEQIVWLARMSAHALADSGAGETPLLPLALLEEAELAGGGPGSQAIHTLCEALLEVGGRGQRSGFLRGEGGCHWHWP